MKWDTVIKQNRRFLPQKIIQKNKNGKFLFQYCVAPMKRKAIVSVEMLMSIFHSIDEPELKTIHTGQIVYSHHIASGMKQIVIRLHFGEPEQNGILNSVPYDLHSIPYIICNLSQDCISITDIIFQPENINWKEKIIEYSASTHIMIAGKGILASLHDGTLKINGLGNIKEYESKTDYPWHSFRNEIVRVEIQEGIKNIPAKAFAYHTELHSVKLPQSIEKIGREAFCGCRSLSNISLPDKVRVIEPCTFFNCTSLKKITFPNKLKTIQNTAFWGCNALQKLKLPDGVEKIGKEVFWYCNSLQQVILPETICVIAGRLFVGCQNLNSIMVPAKILIDMGDNPFIGYLESIQKIKEEKKSEALSVKRTLSHFNKKLDK